MLVACISTPPGSAVRPAVKPQSANRPEMFRAIPFSPVDISAPDDTVTIVNALLPLAGRELVRGSREHYLGLDFLMFEDLSDDCTPQGKRRRSEFSVGIASGHPIETSEVALLAE